LGAVVPKKKEDAMALISCPECGKEISDRASSCPNCGCPISGKAQDKRVRIAIPNTDALGASGLTASLIAKDASVTSGGKGLWKGLHGQMAIFEVEGPTDVVVSLGRWSNPTEGTVLPGHRYQMVQDVGMHWKATFRLSEVDVIDSGL